MRLERLTDNANTLSLKEQRHLEVVLDDFERIFPQCFFAVYLGVLPGMITARDLGFWLINHGAFHTQQIAKRNDFGCALVIDCSRHVASLTLGYALEAHFSRADLERLLDQIDGPLTRTQYGQAVERAVGLFGKRLKQVGSRSLPGLPNSMGGQADLGDLGLQTLRAAHRQPKAVAKS